MALSSLYYAGQNSFLKKHVRVMKLQCICRDADSRGGGLRFVVLGLKKPQNLRAKTSNPHRPASPNSERRS